ncbi:GtrA family protein [uncultured Arcanobacterium sp.]|uniref:GtrA family protein n=1 Tax=uncultured Arcanobacterium sp. TaxID=487520 RepID=UPI0026217455|nr:GtrA family protein [uncultured Arcanobacterium sp.]
MKVVFYYLFFGGTAFIIDFGLLWFCKSILGFPAGFAAFIAFAVSTCYAFLTQQRLTFKSTISTGSSIKRYIFLLVINMIFTVVVVQLFDSLFSLYLLGKIISTGMTTLWNFFLMRSWVFKNNSVSAE